MLRDGAILHLHQPWRLDRCNPFIHSLQTYSSCKAGITAICITSFILSCMLGINSPCCTLHLYQAALMWFLHSVSTPVSPHQRMTGTMQGII